MIINQPDNKMCAVQCTGKQTGHNQPAHSALVENGTKSISSQCTGRKWERINRLQNTGKKHDIINHLQCTGKKQDIINFLQCTGKKQDIINLL